MNLKAPKIGSPFSSRTEEEKEILNQRLNLYKDKLDDQWSDMKSDFVEHGKRAAIIGGVVLGVFGIMNALLPDPDDEPAEQTEVRQAPDATRARLGVPLAGAIQSLLWTVAMSWAKQKVADFVVATKPADTESEA